jgi:hypothetical protein
LKERDASLFFIDVSEDENEDWYIIVWN